MPMKVLFCSSDVSGEVAGPSAWMRRWVAQARELGVVVHVCLYSKGVPEDGSSFSWLRDEAVAFSAVKVRHMRHAVEWTLAEVEKHQPDIVVANNIVPAHYASRWLTPAGIPVVSVLHSDDRFYLRLMESFLDAGSQHRVAGYVAVSQHLREKASPFGGDLPSATIACGAPMPELRASPPAGGDFGLIYVGRISKRQKRILDVGRALCLACAQVPGVRATIVGGGPVEEELRQLLANEPGGDRVKYLGAIPLDEVQPTMAKHHACVLLSDYEGIPIAMMEAMGVGLVPLVTRMESGIPELVEHGETGFFVEDRSAGFVSRVKELSSAPEDWQRVSENARAHVRERFSSERCAERWMKFLKRVIDATPGGKTLELPQSVTFPPVGAGCAWADGSMTKGLRRIYLNSTKTAWSLWRKTPWGIRRKIKKVFRRGW